MNDEAVLNVTFHGADSKPSGLSEGGTKNALGTAEDRCEEHALAGVHVRQVGAERDRERGEDDREEDDREPAEKCHLLQLLPANERVEEVSDDGHREDQAAKVG